MFEPVARWLTAHFGQAYARWLSFQWPARGPAVIAQVTEAAVGLLLTGAVVTAMMRARAAWRA